MVCIIEKPYKYDCPMGGYAIRIWHHVRMNGEKHCAEISRDTGIPPGRVVYHVHRLKARGMVELTRKGSLTFVKAIVKEAV